MALVKRACTPVHAQVPCSCAPNCILRASSMDIRRTHQGSSTVAHRVTIECHLFTLCLRLLKASTSVALGIRHIAGIMVQPLYETALKRWLLVVAALRMLAGSFTDTAEALKELLL